MKKLMNRAGLLAAAFALALAVSLALNAAAPPRSAQAQASNPVADADGNGLIDITTPAQLNGMRYDLNGNGVPDSSESARIACWQSTATTPGLTPASCKGYELKNDISLASAPYNPWTPIPNWDAVFNGNGFNITGLNGNSGLFGVIGADGVVKNLNLVGASITPSGDYRSRAGVLAATNHGSIIGSYASGSVTVEADSANSGALGGLVGVNSETGKIAASVADVEVKVIKNLPAGHRIRVGGFVGLNAGHIHGSYAYGNVIDARTSAGSGILRANGFAINNPGRNGKIYWSISYGNKIVGTATPIPASGPEGTNSCALTDESIVICPTPTATD